MARRQPQPAEPPKPQPGISRSSLLMLLIVALLLLMFILKQLGVDPVEVTDDTEIIQHPHR